MIPDKGTDEIQEETLQQPADTVQEEVDSIEADTIETSEETAPEQSETVEQVKKQMAGKIQKLQTDLNNLTQGMPLEQAKYLLSTGMTMEDLAQKNEVFRDEVIALTEKARAGTLTRSEKKELAEKIEEVKATPASPTLTPEEQANQAWVAEQRKKAIDERANFIKDLEGEDRVKIDEKNFFDPVTRKPRNLIREAIYSNAQRYIGDGLEEKDAYKKAFTLVMHPERLTEEGEIKGLSEALEKGQTTGAISGGKAATGKSITVPAHMKEGYEYRLKTKGIEKARQYVEWRKAKEGIK